MWLARAAVLVVLVAMPRAAFAQSPEAEVLFDEGVRHEDAGDLDQACEAFEASNRIEPRAGTMIRLGACREAQGRLASAWSAFTDALDRVRDPRKRELARARVEALEPRLSYLSVLVSDEVRVEGLTVLRNGEALDPALWNRAIPVDGGAYAISAKVPGHEEWRTSVEVADEGDEVTVEVPKFKAIRNLIDRDDEDSGEDHDDGAGASSDPGGGRRWLGIGVGAVGAALTGVGIGFAVRAKGRFDDARALCGEAGCSPGADYDRATELADAGAHDRQLSIAFIGVGLAAAVGGAYLWLTAPRAERRIDVALGPGTLGVAVSAPF